MPEDTVEGFKELEIEEVKKLGGGIRSHVALTTLKLALEMRLTLNLSYPCFIFWVLEIQTYVTMPSLMKC